LKKLLFALLETGHFQIAKGRSIGHANQQPKAIIRLPELLKLHRRVGHDASRLIPLGLKKQLPRKEAVVEAHQ
jgi:hypothetical protein